MREGGRCVQIMGFEGASFGGGGRELSKTFANARWKQLVCLRVVCLNLLSVAWKMVGDAFAVFPLLCGVTVFGSFTAPLGESYIVVVQHHH